MPKNQKETGGWDYMGDDPGYTPKKKVTRLLSELGDVLDAQARYHFMAADFVEKYGTELNAIMRDGRAQIRFERESLLND